MLKKIFILFVVLLAFGMSIIENKEIKIHATSTNKYLLNLEYTKTYSQYGMNQPSTTTGKDTTLTFGNFNSRTLKVFIYGTSHNSNEITADAGHFYNFNDITIAIETDYSIQRKNVISSYSIRNINGTIVASSTTSSQPTTLYSGNLEDGSYYLNFVWSVEDFMTTQPNYTQSYGTFECTYSFVVDGHAPTITGATTNKDDAYTNRSFTVTAIDTGSGVKNLYMKSPTATSFSVCTNPITISNETNGLYSFYAMDNSGNISEPYYKYVDTKLPTLFIYKTNGTEITESYTKSAFCFQATDESGIDYAEYKTPNLTTWQPYSLGTIITTSATNGVYYFRVIDKGQNVSEIKSICLDTIRPTGTIYNSDGKPIINGSRISTSYIQYVSKDETSGIKRMYVKKPNTSTYVEYSGEKIYDEGNYSFYCIDNADNLSSTSYVTLDNQAPDLICEGAEFYTSVFQDFSIKVTDFSTFTFYYKTPSMTEFTSSSSSTYSVNKSDEEGRYSFYAKDSLGNTSEVYWVELSKPLPEITIVKSDKDNSVYITWEQDLKVTLNGENYEKGTWITQEGKHKIIVSNEYKSQEYEFEITHYYIVDSKKEANCTEIGYTIYKCVHCNDTYQKDYILPSGHQYIETIIEPTCTKEGGIKHVCTSCGDNYISDETEALGHHFIESVKEPTCTEDGGLLHSCTRCNESYWSNFVPATGHVYRSEILLPATCVEDGVRHHVCEKCKDEYSTFIPATDHFYEITKEETKEGITIRTYTCRTCGATYTQNLGNPYEKVSNYIEFLFLNYRPYMLWIFLATSGIWSLALGIAIIIAHKNEEKEKVKKMIVNYVIGMIVIFSILVACPYLIRGISILIEK